MENFCIMYNIIIKLKGENFMAKKSKKNLLGTILAFVAVALSVVTLIMFFVPTISMKDSENCSYSAYEICFISADKATEMAKEETLNGNLNKTAHYSTLATLKKYDNYSGKLNFAGWMGFVSAVSAVIVIVAMILNLFGIKAGLIAGIAVLVMFASSLAGLIGTSSLLSVEVLSTPLKKTYSYGAGVIISFISSTLAVVSLGVKKLKKA